MGKVQNFSSMKSTHFVLQLMAITTRVFRIGALGGGHALQIVRVGQSEQVQRGDGYPFSRTEKH